ncbi:MAG: PPC domain-containing protein [Thermoflexales bacterium]|nr:PPC domain-containing protein [Thermoflexales bacterium]
MKRPILWIGGFVALLLAAGLGCNLTAPLSSPTPEAPTPTPTAPAPEMTPLEYPVGGYNLAYPAGWVVALQQGAIILSPSQDVADAMDWASGPLMIVLSGLPEEVFAATSEEEQTAQSLLEVTLESFRAQEDAEVGEVETRRFARQEGVGVHLGWTEMDTPLRGYLAVYVDEEVVALLLAASPEDQWETVWPQVDAILASMVFYAPQEPTPEPRGALERDVPTEATLKIGGIDEWTYCSPGDEYVNIEVGARGTWDPFLEVFNEAGESIASDDDSGGEFNPYIFGLHLTDPGCYALRISAYDGYGDYQIAVRTGEPPGGGPISYGETVESNLAPGEQEAWTFEAQAGDAVRISMVGSEELTDTYLELFGPDDTLLVSDDESGEGSFALIAGYLLPRAGTYRIVAQSYAGESGPYTLSLEQVTVTVQSITYGQTLSGTLTADFPYGYWTFEGAEGDTVTISMVGVGDMDTYLELYGPDGALLMNDDDSGGNYAALIAGYVLPRTGVYRIVGRSLGDPGPYTMSLAKK